MTAIPCPDPDPDPDPDPTQPAPSEAWIDFVFDGSPGPLPPRFVEVENPSRRSIRFGQWLPRDDGYWVLRMTPEDIPDDWYTWKKSVSLDGGTAIDGDFTVVDP